MNRLYSFFSRTVFGLLPLLILVAAFVPAPAQASCTPNGNDCGPGMACAYLDGTYDCIASTAGSGTNGQPTNHSTAGGSNGAPVSSGSSGGSGSQFYNPLSTGTSLTALLAGILQLVIRIGTVAIILMLVYVGFSYVTARGNPGAIQKAHQALLWTVVGGLILLGSAALAQGICATVVSLGGSSGSCPSLL